MSHLPPPPPDEGRAQRESLFTELKGLDTPDLLALCLGVRGSLDRLRTYLALLRGRSGGRAQLASTLVCFDLARQGDVLAQREFLALAPTLVVLSADHALVASLIGADRYLAATWEACQAALLSSDPRDEGHDLGDDAGPVLELELLTDDDVDFDFDLEPEADAAAEANRVRVAQLEYSALLARQLGQDADGILGDAGFDTRSAADLEKLDAFLAGSASYAARVSPARGMASLGQLYLATHLRQRTLFGRINPRRANALRAGLTALPGDPGALAHAAAIFELIGGSTQLGFEKVLELLVDFLAFCLQQKSDPRAPEAIEAYVAAERQPQPILLTGDSRRRRS